MTKTGEQRMRGWLNSDDRDWELAAMGAEIDWLDGEMDLLLEDLFPLTAGEDVLDQWEALCRPQTADTEMQRRREMLAARLAMNPQEYTPNSFDGQIMAAGVIGTVRESDNGLLVVLGRAVGLTEEERNRELDQILPAHLPWSATQVINWQTLDAWGASFQQWDSRNLKWSQADNLTAASLAQYGIQENG